MHIDCDTCTIRGDQCTDCVVTLLLGSPPAVGGSDVAAPAGAPRYGITAVADPDPTERALRVLAASGLLGARPVVGSRMPERDRPMRSPRAG